MRQLESYNSNEIFDKFKELYELAKENYLHAQEHGYEVKDIDHWCFEAVMGLLGEDIWDSYNDFLR